MAKMIQIVHKDTGGTAVVPERSLKALWADRGWKKVTTSTKKASKK